MFVCFLDAYNRFWFFFNPFIDIFKWKLEFCLVCFPQIDTVCRNHRQNKDLLITRHSYSQINCFIHFYFFKKGCPALGRDGACSGGGGGGRCRIKEWGGAKEEVLVLATNSGLGGALRAALASYRLLRLAPTHYWQQCLQEDVQQRLHHNLHLLLHTLLL